MRISFPSGCVLGVFVFALAEVGCSKRNLSGRAGSPQESAANVKAVFQNAAADVKQQAGEVVTAVQSTNAVAAFSQLEYLSGRQNLTSEQQQALFQMRMALLRQLQEESAKGNAAAEELLNQYRATK